MLLARFAVPRVAVLQDRIVRALGKEREIQGISEAIVNLEKEEVQMIYAMRPRPARSLPATRSS